ncbi:ATP-binding protein [Microlunatus speluncae]|uniref:ATP-binding protein n=1 Tax=Microlunatus speluncae TaxID=2594267 RepID=UPI0012667827
MPLRSRVAYLTSVAVALAVAVSSIAGYVTIRLSLYRAVDVELIEIANDLTAIVARDPQRLGGLTEEGLRVGSMAVTVVRADKKTFHLPGEQTRLVLGPKEFAVARLHSEPSARTGETTAGEPYRIVAVPINGLDAYALVLGRPLQPTRDALSSLWLVLIIFGGAGVIISAAAGAAIARSSLRPVRALTRAVERVAVTDELKPIEVAAGNDEISRLAESFNRMLRSLALSRERQRQLIADSGHELRTPLTSLRTNIELLVSDAGTGMLTSADRSEILHDVSAQLAEFTALIGDLVQLAREDRVIPAPEPIDFRDVVNAALDRVRRRGPRGVGPTEGRSLTFDVELNPFYVIGEADTLERAVTNLLDNAVKWSPPGGTVRVQLEGDRLRVADQGPGIAEEDLPYVFDRFYRSDTSRNTPGTGLGLSIVAQAVHRHGGRVVAGRSAQGGAEFTMRLPGSTTLEGLAATDPTNRRNSSSSSSSSS